MAELSVSCRIQGTLLFVLYISSLSAAHQSLYLKSISHGSPHIYFNKILDLEWWIITEISILDVPSRFVYQCSISSLADLGINGSIITIKSSSRKMYTFLQSWMVIQYPFSLVSSYWEETVVLVANQTTINLYSTGLFLTTWCVINIKDQSNCQICGVK